MPNLIKPLNSKLKGGALLYTLLIMMVLGVLLGMFLLRFRLHSELTQQLEAKINADENAISAVNYFLAIDADKKGPARGTLFGTEADSFWIQTEEWGVFRLVHAKARYGKTEAEKICLVGMRPTENLQAALFLNDNHQPLKIVGKTKITGDAYLPQSGLQIGNIGNRTFEGDSLIRKGTVKKSKSEELNISYKNLSAYFLQLVQLAATSQSQISPPNPSFSIHSYLYNTSNLVGGKIAPLSRIISTQALEISSAAQADLCIFYAPTIRIRSGFKGAIQVFATDSVIVEENVELTYPSSIVVSGSSPNATGLIKLKANTLVEGCVINEISLQKQLNTTENYSYLDKTAKIKGQLLTNGKLELRGSVTGFVAANTLQLATPAAVYMNHLLDAEINYPSLSKTFTTGTLVANNPKYAVITWIQ